MRGSVLDRQHYAQLQQLSLVEALRPACMSIHGMVWLWLCFIRSVSGTGPGWRHIVTHCWQLVPYGCGWFVWSRLCRHLSIRASLHILRTD